MLTLPHLSSGNQTPEALADAFQKYLGYLRVHEEGHQVIARTKLREFRATVEGRVYLNCDEARRSISAMSEHLKANLRVLQASYDDLTEHGRTQGATWPPRDR